MEEAVAPLRPLPSTHVLPTAGGGIPWSDGVDCEFVEYKPCTKDLVCTISVLITKTL